MSEGAPGDQTSLKGAYALKTPEDSVRLYRDWATTYDVTFAEQHGYVVPQELASTYLGEAGPDAGPVLDIGAGTGLVAAELGGVVVDALDLSQEMLDVAGAKGLYRNLIRADLTGTLPIADASYGGLVCAGTFTHGHVGPVCLPELLRVARPGALFVLSINAQFYDNAGFGSAFGRLVADGAIEPMRFRHIRLYAEDADHDHADDTGLMAIFRRL